MKKLDWCLKQSKGIELVEPNENLCDAYLKEAKETLKLITGKDTKWEVIMAYYACYSALYSILMKAGIKCEIHSCTLALMDYIDGFTESDKAFINKLKDKRIDAQYYIKDERLENISDVKEFVFKCMGIKDKTDILELRRAINAKK